RVGLRCAAGTGQHDSPGSVPALSRRRAAALRCHRAHPAPDDIDLSVGTSLRGSGRGLDSRVWPSLRPDPRAHPRDSGRRRRQPRTLHAGAPMSNPPEQTAAAPASVSAEMEILLRRVERERRARKQAEQLLENKSMELYEANQRLQAHAAELERVVHERTRALEQALTVVEESL